MFLCVIGTQCFYSDLFEMQNEKKRTKKKINKINNDKVRNISIRSTLQRNR